MPAIQEALRAYGTAASGRSQREREADVFRRANGALKAARSVAGGMARVRALADNRRLWDTVLGLLYDPSSPLPIPLRASLISVGLSVQREHARPSPDFDFLIAVNENIAAGLSAGR